MIEYERFIVDDAGTLIDLSNKNSFELPSEVCVLLNELHAQTLKLNAYTIAVEDTCSDLEHENHLLKKKLEYIENVLDNSILCERTDMGRNVLMQFRDVIQ